MINQWRVLLKETHKKYGLHQRHARMSHSAASTAATTSTMNFPQIRLEIMNHWMDQEAKSSHSTQRVAMYCNCTFGDIARLYKSDDASWHWLDRELSSNIAGETGAVYIYKGALAALSLRSDVTESARAFAEEHYQNEAAHLRMFEHVVPSNKHTRLLPVWRVAGFCLGFFPTLIGGQRALYLTVESVETFVEEHYMDQIVPLEKNGQCPELVRLLKTCSEEEVYHRDDARSRLLGEDNSAIVPVEHESRPLSHRLWGKIVRFGSQAAAEVARRI